MEGREMGVHEKIASLSMALKIPPSLFTVRA